MADKETTGGRPKSPLISFGVSIFFAVVLLSITELFTDASVMLQPIKLVLLALCILAPIGFYFIKNKKIADIASIITCVAAIILCCLLYYYRNRVLKFFVEDDTLSTEQIRRLVNELKRPCIILIAGGLNPNLPSKLKKYTDIGPEKRKKFNQRIDKEDKNPSDKEIGFRENIATVRLSGIIEKAILITPDGLIPPEKYKEYKIKELR